MGISQSAPLSKVVKENSTVFAEAVRDKRRTGNSILVVIEGRIYQVKEIPCQ